MDLRTTSAITRDFGVWITRSGFSETGCLSGTAGCTGAAGTCGLVSASGSGGKAVPGLIRPVIPEGSAETLTGSGAGTGCEAGAGSIRINCGSKDPETLICGFLQDGQLSAWAQFSQFPLQEIPEQCVVQERQPLPVLPRHLNALQ